MKFISTYPNTFMAEHAGTTFILERSRKGSTKLIVSAMPTDLPGVDELVALTSVPLAIRRAARTHLGIVK